MKTLKKLSYVFILYVVFVYSPALFGYSEQWKRYTFRTPRISIAYDKHRQIAFFASSDIINLTELDFANGPAVLPEKITFEDLSTIRTRGEKILATAYNETTKTLYIATHNNKLEVWSINSPNSPQKLANIDIQGKASDMYLYENFLYLAMGDSGLSVIDISNPSNPIIISSYNTPGKANGIFVHKNYAYIADGDSGVRIIDIHDPQNPHEISFCYTPGYANKVYVSGAFAYVADGDSGLTVVDISSINTPQRVATIDSFDGYCSDVAVKDSFAYVAAKNLYMINISNPANPCVSYNYTPVDSDSIFVVFTIDSFVLTGTRDFGILVLTLNQADTTNIKTAGKYAIIRSFIKGLYLNREDTSLYFTDTFFGLRRVKPWQNDSISYCRTPGASNDVYVRGNYAYVADGDSGLRIIDIHNPDSMYEVGFCYLPGYAKDVYVNGSYAYVAASDAGLVIIDISDPTNPMVTGSYDTPGTAEGVFVSGDYAYIADGDSGLRIINITNPSLPSETGYYDTPGYAYKVSVFGDSAYVADGPGGFRVISLVNPSSPQEVTYYSDGNEAVGVFMEFSFSTDFFAHIVYKNYGIKILIYNYYWDYYSVWYEIPIADAQSYDLGVVIKDILSDYYEAVAEGERGLEIYEVRTYEVKEPSNERISSKITLESSIIKNYITLNFQQPLKDDITIAIYSIDGREVKKYLISPERAETGRRIRIPVQGMRSGVYLLRLKGKNIAITRTIEIAH